MDEKQLLDAIGKMMDEKLEPIRADISSLKTDVATLKDDVSEIKEDSKITRNAVNNLLDWAEEAQVQVKIPLFRKAAE